MSAGLALLDLERVQSRGAVQLNFIDMEHDQINFAQRQEKLKWL
jgi:hypothetical protein